MWWVIRRLCAAAFRPPPPSLCQHGLLRAAITIFEGINKQSILDDSLRALSSRWHIWHFTAIDTPSLRRFGPMNTITNAHGWVEPIRMIIITHILCCSVPPVNPSTLGLITIFIIHRYYVQLFKYFIRFSLRNPSYFEVFSFPLSWSMKKNRKLMIVMPNKTQMDFKSHFSKIIVYVTLIHIHIQSRHCFGERGAIWLTKEHSVQSDYNHLVLCACLWLP